MCDYKRRSGGFRFFAGECEAKNLTRFKIFERSVRMGEFKQDKRSKRTRSAVKIALLKMLKTKPLSEVTVKDLCALAGVNRNSFYTHYTSIDNVFDDFNEDVLAVCDRIFSKYTYSSFRDDPYPLLKEISFSLSSNRHFMEYLVFADATAGFLRKLKDSLCEKIYSVYVSERQDDQPVTPYMISFLVSGTFEIYYRYFNTSGGVPIETVTVWAAEFMKRTIDVLSEFKREN